MESVECSRGESPLEEHRREYDSLPKSCGAARAWIRELLRLWDCEDMTDDVVLVVGELTANAMFHGSRNGSRFRLHVKLLPNAVRVEVVDARPERVPLRKQPLSDDLFGRGLMIIQALANRTGVERYSCGKVVWAELRLPPCKGFGKVRSARVEFGVLGRA
ncbi:ATP-binding protein [Streptomyces alkaliphilus]|uniref:ATP-binding protein n=1 Tax=Streptomyces alkaliphilus TaxID=1472722 RepID=UPI001565B3AA